MPKKDNIRILIDEIYSKPPVKNFPTNEIMCNHIDEKWCVDLAVFSD